MRIIINIDEAKDERKRKAIRVRAGYYLNGKDDIRVCNCGVEIYNLIADAFTGGGFTGGIIVMEGEKK